MNVASIPRVFWYTLSLCMATGTVSLCYISLQSASVSLEIANTKINLSGAVSEASALVTGLQQDNELLRMQIRDLLEEAHQSVAVPAPAPPWVWNDDEDRAEPATANLVEPPTRKIEQKIQELQTYDNKFDAVQQQLKELVPAFEENVRKK